jgi:hypothetical protein
MQLSRVDQKEVEKTRLVVPPCKSPGRAAQLTGKNDFQAGIQIMVVLKCSWKGISESCRWTFSLHGQVTNTNRKEPDMHIISIHVCEQRPELAGLSQLNVKRNYRVNFENI